jgi:extracellular factor (EF) 3-hydroxypalmitic acid methyl ester biosynthesis protein
MSFQLESKAKKADRRSAPRLRAALEVRILGSEGSNKRVIARTVLENISRTGMSFALTKSLRCGKNYKVQVRFPTNDILNGDIDVISISNLGSSFVHRARLISGAGGTVLQELLSSLLSVAQLNDRRRHFSSQPLPIETERRQESKNLNIAPVLLSAEGAKMRLSSLVDGFVRLAFSKHNSHSAFFNKVVSSMHDMCSMIGECEILGVPRLEILDILRDARELHSKSPFVARLQRWPRGYQGDFETIDYLMNQQNFADKDTIQYFIEQYALSSPVAQQHRNKVLYQSELILRAIQHPQIDEETGEKQIPRILVIASGSSPDIRRILPYIAKHHFSLVLNDVDSGALHASKTGLDAISDRVTVVPGNALTNLKKLRSNGPYDLIVAGGLFDYLSTRQINFLLKNAYSLLLKPDGRIAFTNIAAGNPFRLWLEYLADWFLIERNENDIMRILNELYIPSSNISITRDPSQLAIITEIVRARI